MDISKIDVNFKVETQIEKEDIKFYSVEEKPFKIHGVYKEDGKYRRMPEAVAETVSPRVHILSTNTAGGRVRFATDSSYVAISAKSQGFYKTSHGTFINNCGFDLYADNRFVRSFIPPVDIVDGYESVLELGGERKMREITIDFPSFSNVIDLYVGLQEDAVIEEASPYKNEKPIVYYGSSITHGGCASRPGMSYEAIIARELNYDYINLGFSGNAKAEVEIADYIAGLDMSLFVYDYDHNAPSVEHLRETHERLFKKVREKHPELPIIIMPRPKYYLNEEEIVKRDIIKATYENAVASGDKNVYYIDGKELTALCKDNGTVDGTHPTDFGFFSMATAIMKVLETIEI